ncbi:MAG: NADPH-dependent FMN reductase [Bacteroidota bacterium]
MIQDKKPKILAISGSLKTTSSNTTIIREIKTFAGDCVYTIYEELEMLPPFNPDKEAGTEAIQRFKKLLKDADGVIISTPEYAFGVPGALKNALDWTVSSGELNEKPVVAISGSPMYEGGSKALASLLLTLSALGTKMNEHSSLSIANISNKIRNGRIHDEPTLQALKVLYDHLMLMTGAVKNH